MTTSQLERRVAGEPFEVRANADGTIGVRGYAAVFDYEAHGEVIRSAAFNRTIAQKDDIRLLVNHEGVPLARTKSGTLEVGVDARGFWFDAPSLSPTNPDVQRLISAMERQDIDQCSFAGYFTDTRNGAGGVREVHEVKAVDVSIVTYPWYDATAAGLTGDRELDRALVTLRALAPEQRETVLNELRAAPPGKESFNDLSQRIRAAVKAKLVELGGGSDVWVWIDDFGDDWAVYSIESDQGCRYYQVAWSVASDNSISLGDAFEVSRVATYTPVEVETSRGLSVTEARALLGI